jgi:hypothetical protein
MCGRLESWITLNLTVLTRGNTVLCIEKLHPSRALILSFTLSCGERDISVLQLVRCRGFVELLKAHL